MDDSESGACSGSPPSNGDLPIFAYWADNDRTKIASMIAEWSGIFSNFRVFGDDDVVPLLRKYCPDFLAPYRRIQIPAAKSDVARLLLLYEYGGLYVDCHMGVLDDREIIRLLSELPETGVILIDRKLSMRWRPDDEHFFINGIIFSVPQSALILAMLRQAVTNLSEQYERELSDGFAPYTIFLLSGPGMVTGCVLDPESANRCVRKPYDASVAIIREELAPIVRDRHRTYGGSGRHWSERQRTESLFYRDD